MPLYEGVSKKIISKNIVELVHSKKLHGPKKDKVKQAVAIALQKAKHK